jgi:NADH dehydrogenase [ubiquinone] 1 alpha subcomplex assembly factor 5
VLGNLCFPAHMRGMDSMLVFDRSAVRRHRDRAAATVGSVADVLRDAAERLVERLDDTTRRFSFALDVGGRGVVAPLLRARGIEVVSCDLSAKMAALNGVGGADKRKMQGEGGRGLTSKDSAASPPIPNPPPTGGRESSLFSATSRLCVAADEEFLPFGPASFDLIVASLSLHAVNDLPGALIQLRRALKPDGLLLASMPALGTLSELRAALTGAETALTGGVSPRVSPFPELRDCAGLLQRAGFAVPVADMEEIRLLYADPFALLRDLRAAGEGNAVRLRDRRVPPRGLFPMALAGLPVKDGRAAVSLRMAMLTGWAPAGLPTPPTGTRVPPEIRVAGGSTT